MVGIVFFSSICLTTLGLGVWQTKRYFWKVGLIDEAAERYARDEGLGGTHLPAAVLNAPYSALAAHVRELEGQKICLRGHFDHSREVLVGPRAAPPGLVSTAAQGMATNPMGYYMYTPFELQDGGHIVFVNRGWISKGAMEGKGSPSISRPEGALELGQLVVSKGEPRNRFTPSNDEQSIRTKKLLWVEPASLEAAAGLKVTTRRAVATAFVVEKDAEVSASWSNWWFQSAKTATDTTEKTAAAEREDAEKEREELQQLQAMLAEEEEKKAPVEAIIVEVIATDDAIVDSYPVARRYKQLTEFAVAPVTHLTYAATWFSLSAAGFFMTYRLFKGKGNGLKRGGKNVI